MIPVGPWRPDSTRINGGFAADVEGAVPLLAHEGGMLWGPWPKFSAITGAAADALLAARSFIFPGGTAHTFAGSIGKLFKLNNSTLAIEDVSEAMTTYTAATSARWDFERFGNNIVATNVNDGAQVFEVGVDSAFSALGGSPTAAHLVSVWKDQMVFGALSGALESVQWSEIDDIADYTGGNSSTQAFPGFGEVTALSRGNRPMVVQEEGIQRGVFTGGDSVFEFDTLTQDFGCRIRGGCAFRRDIAYMWTDEGFRAVAPSGEVALIGHAKVDRWAQRFINFKSDAGFQIVADPINPRIYVACNSSFYPGDDALNTLLIYDIAQQEWGKVAFTAERLLPVTTPGVTLEGLDSFGTMETLPYSLDSSVWRSDFPVIGAINADKKIGQFVGANSAAKFETGEMEPGKQTGRRAKLKSVRPVIDAENVTVTHRFRDYLPDTMSSTAAQSIETRNGVATFINNARFHQILVDVPDGESWTTCDGVDAEFRLTSKR